ncbi:MAG: IS481 family transposase, partial [Paracoccaceae bacterium]
QRFDWWRDRYNFERPHQGIGDQVPMDRYRPSRRNYPETLPPVKYDQTDDVRKVNPDGYIIYQAHRYKIGKGFIGRRVAVRKQKDTPKKMVYFCHQPIKEISPKTVN